MEVLDINGLRFVSRSLHVVDMNTGYLFLHCQMRVARIKPDFFTCIIELAIMSRCVIEVAYFRICTHDNLRWFQDALFCGLSRSIRLGIRLDVRPIHIS